MNTRLEIASQLLTILFKDEMKARDEAIECHRYNPNDGKRRMMACIEESLQWGRRTNV